MFLSKLAIKTSAKCVKVSFVRICRIFLNNPMHLGSTCKFLQNTCCVQISTSFWVLHKNFFRPFVTFLFIFQPFSVISGLKSTKISQNNWKTLKKVKNQPIKMISRYPQGVDQHWEVDKNTFFGSFSDFFVDFSRKITAKGEKWTKKVENGWKLSGARSTWKLVEIHNKQTY